MSNLGLFVSNFGAYLILFLVFAGCATVAAFAGIALRKKMNEKDTATNGEVTKSET